MLKFREFYAMSFAARGIIYRAVSLNAVPFQERVESLQIPMIFRQG